VLLILWIKDLGLWGREDVWQSEEDIYWGSERKWLDDNRYTTERELNPVMQ
jgi:catalase-peroxidase